MSVVSGIQKVNVMDDQYYHILSSLQQQQQFLVLDESGDDRTKDVCIGVLNISAYNLF